MSVVLCHWDHFKRFLDTHDYITNKLACLVRDTMELEYIPTVLSVITAFGIQLIEPYFIIMKKSDATHSQLQSSFTDMHAGLKFDDIGESFLGFTRAVSGV